MCGRYTLVHGGAAVADLFGLDAPAFAPRYNVAPTQTVLAVRLSAEPAGLEALPLRWGLLPPWAAGAGGARPLFNARSETAAEKPSFRHAFRRRRCLLAADGFFEWQAQGRHRQPFLFRRPDRRPFLFAGLWERWVGADGGAVETCALLTTSANAVVRPIHDRMPVLVGVADVPRWLDPTAPAEALQALLRPAPDEELAAVAVRAWVNHVRNDDPRCLEPLQEPTLFDRDAG